MSTVRLGKTRFLAYGSAAHSGETQRSGVDLMICRQMSIGAVVEKIADAQRTLNRRQGLAPGILVPPTTAEQIPRPLRAS